MIHPLNELIAIEPLDQEESVTILPGEAEIKKAKVVSIGNELVAKEGLAIEKGLSVGDIVFYMPDTETIHHEYDGKKFQYISVFDLLSTINNEHKT